jgi:hypothetical protein
MERTFRHQADSDTDHSSHHNRRFLHRNILTIAFRANPAIDRPTTAPYNYSHEPSQRPKR